MARAGFEPSRGRLELASGHETGKLSGGNCRTRRKESALARFVERYMNDSAAPSAPPLKLLSVVIPARDEAGCICSTVEHLHLELQLNKVPHEIIVVDDGSTGATWELLRKLAKRIPEVAPIKNEGLHGFGRAITRGLD